MVKVVNCLGFYQNEQNEQQEACDKQLMIVVVSFDYFIVHFVLVGMSLELLYSGVVLKLNEYYIQRLV